MMLFRKMFFFFESYICVSKRLRKFLIQPVQQNLIHEQSLFNLSFIFYVAETKITNYRGAKILYVREKGRKIVMSFPCDVRG